MPIFFGCVWRSTKGTIVLAGSSAVLWLLLFSGSFALAGVWHARRSRDSLEDFMVARNSQTATATVLTLVATSLGAWILFAPAQAASWAGLAAIMGYAMGAMAPRIAMIVLGGRMRLLMPRGHSLTEFVRLRYGRGMHGLILAIMFFYLFIALSAEITAMARLVALIAPVPLWLTAAIVLGCTLLYTAWGGLRASIFTDQIQMLIIVPLLGVLLLLGWQASGGATTVLHKLQAQAPQLLDWSNITGLKAGLTFFLAVLLTGLFHQGNWQRVYAAGSPSAMRRGFFLGGVLVAPVIFCMGLFGLAFVAQGSSEDASVAVFSVLVGALPGWFVVALIPLGLALVMSSADTAISAVASMVAVDARRLLPDVANDRLLTGSKVAVCALAIPVWWLAAQGYSVLYLFLLADLLCAAAAFPVFYGLYAARYSGRLAFFSSLAGLLAGLWRFPPPGPDMDRLLESFLLAAFVPVLVSVLLARIGAGRPFDFARLQTGIRQLQI